MIVPCLQKNNCYGAFKKSRRNKAAFHINVLKMELVLNKDGHAVGS